MAEWPSTSTASDVAMKLIMMRFQAFVFAAAATAVEAAQYSVADALANANQPFSEAFVSYSIEFSSFPDFAGENILQNVP